MLLLLSTIALLAAQETTAPATAALQISGAVKQPLSPTADDLARMPRASLRTTANGMETVYDGVSLHEILKKAGRAARQRTPWQSAGELRVLAAAQDGYQVLFSAAEVDPAFIDNQILLADTANGKALFGAQGGFGWWFRETNRARVRCAC